jgi:hypothetical protein
LTITATDEKGQKIGCDKEGNRYTIPLDNPSAFNLYEEDRQDFAAGEKIRITASGKDMDGREVYNGDRGTIREFSEEGDIILESGRKLSKDFGHFNYAYTSTSYAAQGSTVDVVLASMPEQDAPALSSESFYVTVSRGRGGNAENIRIYTDNLEAVKEHTASSSARLGVCEINKYKQPEPNTQARQQRYYADYLAAEQGLGHDSPELNQQAQELVNSGGVNYRQHDSQEY